MSQLYKLKLRPGFPAERRRRADIELVKGETLTTELTEEQLAAVSADDYITVEPAEEGAEEGAELDLGKLKRNQLEPIAVELGLDPSDYKNKESLVNAIESAQNGGTPEEETPKEPETPETPEEPETPEQPEEPETPEAPEEPEAPAEEGAEEGNSDDAPKE